MNTPKTHSRIYFEHLDIVRFIAAFSIIILHAFHAWNGWFGKIESLTDSSNESYTSFGKIVDQFINNLGIGVDVFFLISGFLITYILIIEKNRFNTIHIGKFMIRRSLRIWPLYFLLIIIAPFLTDWLASEGDPNYLMNSLFLGNFEIIHSTKWTYPFAHFWSIAIEEHFYLVWPFIIYFVKNKHLLSVFVFIIFCSIAFRIYTFETSDAVWLNLYLHTISRIDILVVGAIGAVFYERKPFTIKLSRTIRIILITLLVTGLSIQSTSTLETVFMAGFNKFFFIGIIAILLLDFNFNPSFKHLLPNKSIIHYLGKISYGIYMYGNIIILYVIKKIMWVYQIQNMWIFFFLVGILSIIVPILSYELFEKQVLKLNARFRVVKTNR